MGSYAPVLLFALTLKTAKISGFSILSMHENNKTVKNRFN